MRWLWLMDEEGMRGSRPSEVRVRVQVDCGALSMDAYLQQLREAIPREKVCAPHINQLNHLFC